MTARELFAPAAGTDSRRGAAEITRAALMERVAHHLQPFEPAAIAQAVNGNERSAAQWQERRALPSATYLSRLRRLLPGLAADLSMLEQGRLEAADASADAAHADQYGPRARLADGD